jgi:cytochrome b involved in lipid metabolism
MVKYFTPEEVAVHNCAEDCWVIVYDDVFDLTELVSKNPGELVQPILKNAGLSVSHWFNKATRNVRTYVDPVKNIDMPFLPEGRFLHVPPEDPQPWSTADFEKPWWKDEKYAIGKVSFVLFVLLFFCNAY